MKRKITTLYGYIQILTYKEFLKQIPVKESRVETGMGYYQNPSPHSSFTEPLKSMKRVYFTLYARGGIPKEEAVRDIKIQDFTKYDLEEMV